MFITQDQIEELGAAVFSVLKENLAEFKDRLSSDYLVHAQIIAEDVAHYTLLALQGDPRAARNLLHLKAQALLLGSKMALQEQSKIIDVVRNVATIALQILLKVFTGISP